MDGALRTADPQGGVQIHMQVEDGEIMCVKIKEEEIPADIDLHGSSERNPPERRLRLRYSHGLKPEKEEERLNIVLVNTDPLIDGDSSYLDNKEEEIPIDFCPVASEPLGTHSRIVKNRTSSCGRASTFSHTRKRPSATRMSDSRGYIEVNSLIMAVSHQPAIWDARDPSYMDRLKRSHAWESVCQEVTEDWDDLHTKTKDRRCKHNERSSNKMAFSEGLLQEGATAAEEGREERWTSSKKEDILVFSTAPFLEACFGGSPTSLEAEVRRLQHFWKYSR
ncbi:uncharacterized protein [Dendrobates tinctorius]|uniref:uncharacterized protein isoform X6 n=1 Tax=Dendrobates tinctorius TaxID=92724 RepID=UPI003CCA3630